MSVLLTIHSVVRWLIVIVAVVAAVKFAIGWLRGGTFSSIDQRLASSFSGLIDLQVTLGPILLIWSGLAGAGFPRYRIEHAVIMIIAAVVAHLQVRWKNADDKTRFRNSMFIILDTLIIIFIGVAVLPGGWSR
jgi:hypothetical protein